MHQSSFAMDAACPPRVCALASPAWMWRVLGRSSSSIPRSPSPFTPSSLSGARSRRARPQPPLPSRAELRGRPLQASPAEWSPSVQGTSLLALHRPRHRRFPWPYRHCNGRRRAAPPCAAHAHGRTTGVCPWPNWSHPQARWTTPMLPHHYSTAIRLWRATVIGTAVAELPARVDSRPQPTSGHDSATYGCGLARRCSRCPSPPSAPASPARRWPAGRPPATSSVFRRLEEEDRLLSSVSLSGG
jgi:hypothetical protein